MNTIWSDHVQGISTLYLSRKLRFDDLFFHQYSPFFNLDQNKRLRILEVGCGPGALAEALHRWYPNAEIVGVDRDSAFIAFAQKKVVGVTFMEGDATRLPFPDEFFDVTISNTVQEHIEPSAFWGEQKRVLKPGGICLCLSARKGIRCRAACLDPTEEELAFWNAQPNDEHERFQVCRFPMSESELPVSMEKNGFYNVSVGYAVVNLTPDDPQYEPQFAEAMIEADRQCDLEAILSAHYNHAESALRVVNNKHDKRLQLYRSGEKQWDTCVCVTMILRGTK